VTFGYSTTSCHAIAAEATYGSLTTYLTYEGYRSALLRQLSEADERAQTSPGFQSAMDGWSTCMDELGYHADTPIELAGRFASDPSSDSARAAATADVTCKARSNLLSVWGAELDAGLSNADSLIPVLAEFRDIRQGVVRRATDGERS